MRILVDGLGLSSKTTLAPGAPATELDDRGVTAARHRTSEPQHVEPAPARSIMVAVAATPSAVRALRRLVSRVAHLWALPDAVVDALALISSELVTNAVIHSGTPDVELLLAVNETHAVLRLRDFGCWHEPCRRPDAVPTGGRGLALVFAHAQLQLSSDASGTVATARVALNPTATETPARPGAPRPESRS